MGSTYFISDTHFGHSNILKFKRDDGTPLRDFNSVEEMDEVMVQRWNDIVKPKDLVWHLGDVAIQRKGLKILERLNGRKKLLRGNHDIWKVHDFLPYFEDVASVHVLPEHRLLFSHYPMHPSSLYGGKLSVHGHTHFRDVIDINPTTGILENDPRFINLSVEQINYTPVSWEQLLIMVQERRQIIEERKNV